MVEGKEEVMEEGKEVMVEGRGEVGYLHQQRHCSLEKLLVEGEDDKDFLGEEG
jgi:hypothetical protein